MPRFKVTVTSESPVETGQTLNGANIPTIGPAMARFRDAPDNDWTISDQLTAVLDAPDASTAARLVREVIGDDSEVVGDAEPWGTD